MPGQFKYVRVFFWFVLMFIVSTVFAHPRHVVDSAFLAGAVHPILGIDHLLILIALGMLIFLRVRTLLLRLLLFAVTCCAIIHLGIHAHSYVGDDLFFYLLAMFAGSAFVSVSAGFFFRALRHLQIPTNLLNATASFVSCIGVALSLLLIFYR